jgi:uncharacterized protein YndB with AHSA1/START domain
MKLHEACGAVRRERLLPADRQTTWALLAEPSALEGWLADEVDLERLEEGAAGTLRWDDGEERAVVVEEVEPLRRLTMRWEAPGGGAATLVELTLDDAGDGTVVRVVELPLTVLRAVGAGLEHVTGGPAGPVALAA